MANIDLVTADKVHVVGVPRRQFTSIALEAIEAGAPVRFDVTTGKFRNGNATDMTEGNVYGLATQSVAAGFPCTAIAEGVMSGWDHTDQDFGEDIYVSDTDGRIADAAGTKAILVGRIVPGWANGPTTADKLLDVNIAHHAVVS